MRKISLLLAILMCASALAQEVVQTKDGRYVLLKPDGTWVEMKEKPAPGAKSKSGPPPVTSSPAKPDATPKAETPPVAATPAHTGTPSGEKTATGKDIYVGPRGGHYHYSASGRKVYERKK